MTADDGPRPFGVRLRVAMDRLGPLCVGIDPHPALLRAWGLHDDLRGLERFARTAVEAFAGHVAAVKPQSAFFERFGSRGVGVLERVIADLRDSQTLCVVDAKRGDIGSTMQAYADAYCGNGSTLAGDAVTVSPYLGFESLRPLLDVARANHRGVFVLALTSNPSGPQVQHATTPSGESVAGQVVRAVAAENAGRDPLGSVGLVVGATVGDAVSRLGIDLGAAGAPLLAPGFGSQGGDASDLRRIFAGAAASVLASSSRDVLALREAAVRTAGDCAAALGRVAPHRS